MPEPEVTPEPSADFRSLVSNGKWAAALAWSTSKPLTASLGAIALLRGLVPAALALFARGLINVTADLAAAGGSDLTPIVPWIVFGCAISLVEAMAPSTSRLCQQRLRDEMNLRVSSDIIEHAAALDLEFFESPSTRQIIERAQANTAEHAVNFLNNLILLVTTTIQLVSLATILALIEPLVLLVLGPYAVPYLVFRWRLSRQRYSEEHARTAKRRWTSYFVARVTSHDSVPEVKMLGIAPVLIDRFRSLMKMFRDRDRALHQREFRGSSLFAALTTIAFFVLFFRVAKHAIEGGLTIGDVAVFGAVTTRLRQTVEGAIFAISNAMRTTLHISNLKQFLEIEPTVPSVTDAAPLTSIGEIEFDDVWFTYPGAPEPTLRGTSFRLRAREIVGLVGQNGAGKSTAVKLLCRLYDPQKGSIRVDGVDLRDIPRESLHAQIAFVLQNFGRYEASAADNIAFGDWQRLGENPEEIQRVARHSGVHEMVEAFPEGYDTQLGRMFGDFTLSGGQWQYLALARAFARDASLLILDEPTASLDAGTEYRLFCRFRDLANGRTTLLISHRFSTIGMADRILVMDEGQIVESGSHQELMEAGGGYAALYRQHRHQIGAAGMDEEPTAD
jgi:ATP-binding cassette subfamily B protein